MGTDPGEGEESLILGINQDGRGGADHQIFGVAEGQFTLGEFNGSEAGAGLYGQKEPEEGIEEDAQGTQPEQRG